MDTIKFLLTVSKTDKIMGKIIENKAIPRNTKPKNFSLKTRGSSKNFSTLEVELLLVVTASSLLFTKLKMSKSLRHFIIIDKVHIATFREKLKLLLYYAKCINNIINLLTK